MLQTTPFNTLGVIQTLFHRAETVITDPQAVTEEKAHVTQALSKCGYPKRAFNKISEPKKAKSSANNNSTTSSKGQILLPYIKGISEALCRNFKKIWFQGMLQTY